MANQLSGQTGASPREYNNHQRYAKSARHRYALQSAAWIARIVTKLSSSTSVIYGKLTKYGASRVNAAASLSDIP